jgi:hypothetical protein
MVTTTSTTGNFGNIGNQSQTGTNPVSQAPTSSSRSSGHRSSNSSSSNYTAQTVSANQPMQSQTPTVQDQPIGTKSLNGANYQVYRGADGNTFLGEQVAGNSASTFMQYNNSSKGSVPLYNPETQQMEFKDLSTGQQYKPGQVTPNQSAVTFGNYLSGPQLSVQKQAYNYAAITQQNKENNFISRQAAKISAEEDAYKSGKITSTNEYATMSNLALKKAALYVETQFLGTQEQKNAYKLPASSEFIKQISPVYKENGDLKFSLAGTINVGTSLIGAGFAAYPITQRPTATVPLKGTDIYTSFETVNGKTSQTSAFTSKAPTFGGLFGQKAENIIQTDSTGNFFSQTNIGSKTYLRSQEAGATKSILQVVNKEGEIVSSKYQNPITFGSGKLTSEIVKPGIGTTVMESSRSSSNSLTSGSDIFSVSGKVFGKERTGEFKISSFTTSETVFGSMENKAGTKASVPVTTKMQTSSYGEGYLAEQNKVADLSFLNMGKKGQVSIGSMDDSFMGFRPGKSVESQPITKTYPMGDSFSSTKSTFQSNFIKGNAPDVLLPVNPKVNEPLLMSGGFQQKGSTPKMANNNDFFGGGFPKSNPLTQPVNNNDYFGVGFTQPYTRGKTQGVSQSITTPEVPSITEPTGKTTGDTGTDTINNFISSSTNENIVNAATFNYNYQFNQQETTIGKMFPVFALGGGTGSDSGERKKKSKGLKGQKTHSIFQSIVGGRLNYKQPKGGESTGLLLR